MINPGFPVIKAKLEATALYVQSADPGIASSRTT